ncbi:hypothetical protein, partial [Glutamicibacter sp. V16R2B1]|uniref:hypothetical protein n=1 Tax=Glutamicibacter sp. V16R2B1 TaxID=2036207 RepID=UPI0010FF07B8
MRIAKAGDLVAYVGSKETHHGLARVLEARACWCLHCNGTVAYRIAPIFEDGTSDMGNTLSHVRP